MGLRAQCHGHGGSACSGHSEISSPAPLGTVVLEPQASTKLRVIDRFQDGLASAPFSPLERFSAILVAGERLPFRPKPAIPLGPVLVDIRSLFGFSNRNYLSDSQFFIVGSNLVWFYEDSVGDKSTRDDLAQLAFSCPGGAFVALPPAFSGLLCLRPRSSGWVT